MKTIFTLLLLLANFSFCISQTKIVTKEKPLFVVNNEIVFESLINEIDPNIIESVIVLKNEKALGKYGDKGKNGVIEVTLKDTLSIIILNKKHLTNIELLNKIDKKKVKNVYVVKDKLYTSQKKFQTISLTTKKIKKSELEELRKKYSLNSNPKFRKLIKHKTIYLLGGITASLTKEDLEFANKYGFTFHDFGCIAPVDFKKYESKNAQVFDWLNETYGTDWQKEMKASALGFEKWKKKE